MAAETPIGASMAAQPLMALGAIMEPSTRAAIGAFRSRSLAQTLRRPISNDRKWEVAMGAEKELEPGGHDKDNTHIVQATDGMGRTVSRDAFKSQEEADKHAAELKAQGHRVEISSLQRKPKEQL